MAQSTPNSGVLRHYFGNSASLLNGEDSATQCSYCSKRYVKIGKVLRLLGLVGLALLFLIFILYQLQLYGFHVRFPHTSDALRGQNESVDNLTDGVKPQIPSGNTTAIPNVVHFVHLVEPGPHPKYEFPFHQFVAIYSAHHYLNPEAIYILTNVANDKIHQVLDNSTSAYTQAVLKLPTVQFKYHGVTSKTTKGLQLTELAHQADFIRTDVLRRHGGIYLDDDAYILRDLSPLRHSGFSNIIGNQIGGDICNAVMLSTPHNDLMTAYYALQDKLFDGSWQRHSVYLLSTLAQKFAAKAQQVLVLPQDTFFPLSWNVDDLHTLYDVHNDDEDDDKSPDMEGSIPFEEYFTGHVPNTWRRDWRTSYILHGWTSAIGNNLGTDKMMEETFGRFGGITLEYVLARNSNFARAVYPAVRHALDKGVLDHVRFDHGDGRNW
ncbi:hypothetical protein ACLMJK_008187 [Lecanora helva]